MNTQAQKVLQALKASDMTNNQVAQAAEMGTKFCKRVINQLKYKRIVTIIDGAIRLTELGQLVKRAYTKLTIKNDASVAAMTGRQWDRVADSIIRTIQDHQVYTLDREFKQIELNPPSKTNLAFLHTVYGIVGDEQTHAYYVRERRHLRIGVRGGLQLLNTGKLDKDGNKTRAKTKATGNYALYAFTS